jgi:multicomponent Na+:H+ antiporter subunit C
MHPGPFALAVAGGAIYATATVGTSVVFGRVTDEVIVPAFRGHVAGSKIVAGALVLLGGLGIARSRNLVHAIACLFVSQSGTYVLLLAVGYQKGAPAPVFGSTTPPSTQVADPVVQALTLTDVVSATVTALLLALAVQIAKKHGTVDPDELSSLEG